MRSVAAVLGVAVVVCVAACGRDGGPSVGGRVEVVAAFYPAAFLAERIGGDAVAVTLLTPAGAEPHDLELKASQVAELRSADLAIYLRGFQPAVDQAVRRDRALDLAAVEPDAEPTGDPHVWLDPLGMVALAGAVTDRLAALAPDQSSAVRTRGAELVRELRALHADHRARLGPCARRDVVTSHEAFGHLTRRYGLRQVGIAGLSPDEEPTARRLAQVARTVRERGITTIFFETLVSPKLAQTVAGETGAKVAVLDPIEGVESGSDRGYLDLMRANLDALTEALGCR